MLKRCISFSPGLKVPRWSHIGTWHVQQTTYSYDFKIFGRKKSSSTIDSSEGSSNNSKTLPVDGEFTSSIEVKKSRFVAFAWHVKAEEEALALIGQVRDPSASHTCWAIRIGQKVRRCSDDGEPSGTAGRPILNTIESMNLDQVSIAVVRYYGGTKLGTGGLCRAYSRAARELLQEIPLEELIPMREVSITVPTEFLGTAFHVIESHGGKSILEKFDEKHGDRFVVQFDVEETEYTALQNHLRESSRGKITFNR